MNFSNDEKIGSGMRFKCSKCGGAKYVDDPYLVASTWFVDLTCLSCGHSKDIEVEEFKKVLKKIGAYS